MSEPKGPYVVSGLVVGFVMGLNIGLFVANFQGAKIQANINAIRLETMRACVKHDDTACRAFWLMGGWDNK